MKIIRVAYIAVVFVVFAVTVFIFASLSWQLWYLKEKNDCLRQATVPIASCIEDVRMRESQMPWYARYGDDFLEYLRGNK